MQKATLMLAFAVLTLTACASGPKQTPEPTLYPSESDMASCEALPVLQSGEMTDLLANHIAVAKAYHECRDRHQGLINWLEKTSDLR